MITTEVEVNRTPAQTMIDLLTGFWVSRALYVAARLGLADLVGEQPVLVAELARGTGAHADSLYRVMRALASATRHPLFVQTSGGAPGMTLSVERLVALAGEFPHLGYIKEEADPVIPRMQALHRARPALRRVFSGAAGKGLLYELRLGMDGTMPGSPYSDIYIRIWDAWHAGDFPAAHEIFSKLLLMINLDQVTPGARQYNMKKRGVFRTMVSRRQEIRLSSPAIEEIEFCWEALRPYTKA